MSTRPAGARFLLRGATRLVPRLSVWSPPSPSEWAPLPARPSPSPSCAPGGDAGPCGSSPASPFSLHVECSGSKRGRAAFRLGWHGSRVALEGLCEQAGPGLGSCSEITDGGKARRPLPHNPLFAPLQRPPRSSRLSQNSPELYLCPSSARIEKAVRKEGIQTERNVLERHIFLPQEI